MPAGWKRISYVTCETSVVLDYLGERQPWFWYAFDEQGFYLVGSTSMLEMLEHAQKQRPGARLLGPYSTEQRAMGAAEVALDLSLNQDPRHTRPEPVQFCQFCFACIEDTRCGSFVSTAEWREFVLGQQL